MREPFFVAGRWCGKVDVDFCRRPLVGKLQIWKGDDNTLLSISPGNRPPEGCRGQYETTGCRGLFSYKSPLFCKLRISLQNSPAKAPDDKGFRPLRRATKDAVFGNCHLLKKVDENFISRNWVPRGRSSGYLLNRYVNWVQAQPGVRHHAAVNWVQAQPVVDWVLMVTATRLGMQTALCSSLSSQPNPMQRWSGQSEDRKWMR